MKKIALTSEESRKTLGDFNFYVRTAAIGPAQTPGVHPKQHYLDALQAPDGGFSHNPVYNTKPTQRYMVAIPGATEHIHDIGKITADDIDAHHKAIQPMLHDPNTFAGGWHNPADGKAYLDVSKQYNDLNGAMTAARNGKQLAIFDNHTGSSVPVPQQQPLV